ncbi:MAG: type II toxin-antitoxin system HipA family toxin YjjJ [Nevskia sp.]|uniref:type II toxin-antitoxin system HipA family toxin YjjJ n=1 Tax=Nevskia sp. TaxID=1929292 RepID=UPI004036891F
MEDRLFPFLMAGPRSAAEIAERLAVSQPTVSRLLARHTPPVIALGRGRAARYGLRRAIRALEGDLPVYRIDIDGRASEIGLLAVLHGGVWYQSLDGGTSAVYDDLPWFLDDMRPQGFIGRALATGAEDLGLPARLSDWSTDQSLYWMAQRGEDAVGNLIVGAESLQRFLARPSPQTVRRTDYPALAAAALAGEVGGSSPGGEQPKFTAWTADADGDPRPVLVKFSEPLDTPSGRRWGDLLIAESLAADCIGAAGIAAACSQAFEAGGRMFIEVERFDRIGLHGRQGLISLAAVDDQFVGGRAGWHPSALALVGQRLLSAEDADRIAWLSAFGALIANSDMHFGNLSLLFDGRWPLRLAPSYDMLPMLYAPLRGEVRDPLFQPRLPLSRALAQGRAAQIVAVQFWQRVAEDARVSPGFRALAATNAGQVEALRL